MFLYRDFYLGQVINFWTKQKVSLIISCFLIQI
jgi:hypothetical protein